MSGVNLIDFNMPSPVPVPAGRRRNVGGMKLILPKKSKTEKEGEVKEKLGESEEVNWTLILFLLGGLYLILKLVRRYGK